MDYKERWQQFFEEAQEECGLSDTEAGKVADASLRDHYASLADDLKDRRKEMGS